ncbi:MAG: FAD-dependent monooxygenase [Planctomycetota bacterium]
MSRTLETEALIVGGGPAGATLAGCLARGGHRVLLCDDGKRQHPVPFETLLPAARHALERAKVRDPIERLGSAPPVHRFAIWGTDQAVVQESGPDEQPGVRIRRGAFERGLRDWARSQGASVLEGARVAGALPEQGPGTVEIEQDGSLLRCHAEVFVSAAGRRASEHLAESRVFEAAPETASLGIVADIPDLDHAHDEVVEATEHGWHWWMPLDDSKASLTVFLDHEEMQRLGTQELLDRCLRQSRGPGRAFAGRQPSRAARATARLLQPADHVLLCGDACSTIDPLSSQGTEKAIASGENTAALVQLILERNELRDLATATQWRWECGLWRGHRRATEQFHAFERRFADAPFWQRRRGSSDEESSSQPPRALQVTSGIEKTAMLDRFGERYELVEGFALPSSIAVDGPLSQVGPIPIEPILDAFAEPQSIAEGLRAAARDPRIYVQSQRSTIEAIGLLHQRGFLNEVAR